MSDARDVDLAKALTGVSTVAALLALAFLPFAVPLWLAGIVGLVVLFWIVPGLDTDSVRVVGLRRWPEATAIVAALIGMIAIYSGPRWRYLAMGAASLVIASACVAWRERYMIIELQPRIEK
jgi:hypothetical protein